MSIPPAQFTTRARVVDLLGREQIADAPTAMGELFKNAIDAGASKVRIDYWPEQGCLSMGDDGIGMRLHEELLAKWFVLATESKHGHKRLDQSWIEHATEEQKHQLPEFPFGKKGIGRLAIALLGSGTLVWTRWGSPDALQRTLLLVPWSLFKHPLLTLDQIEIPIMRLDRHACKEDAHGLVDQALEWVKGSKIYSHGVPADVHENVLADLTLRFQTSLQAPLKFAEGPGTQFIVLKTDEIVANHFAGWIGQQSLFGDDEKENYPEGPKAYLAFNNPFTTPRLDIALYVNDTKEKLDQLDYWTAHDFETAEHHVSVTVDDQGFARGTVRNGQQIINYERNLGAPPPRTRSPGPILVEVGYVGGKIENTSLSPEAWTSFDQRLKRFGGFLVYMNGVRVCPYGRDDADFVSFEKRRSMNAGRYYWSHRRMFGGVFLTAAANASRDEMLQEKAGREGFVQNGAFHGLVSYLKALFIDLADSYFGSKAPERPGKEKRDRRFAERERRKQERERRLESEIQAFQRSFTESCKLLPKRIAEFRDAAAELGSRAEHAKTDMFALDQCVDLLDSVRQKYDSLWQGLIAAHPSTLGLPEEETEAIEDYLTKKAEFDLEATRLVTDLAETVAKIEISRSTGEPKTGGWEEEVGREKDKMRQLAHAAAENALRALAELSEAIRNRPDADIASLEQMQQDFGASAEHDRASVERLRAAQMRKLQEEKLPFYDKVITEANLLAKGDSDLIAIGDLREELRTIREQQKLLFELAQLGLVMESTDHDYHAMMGRAMDAFATIEQAKGQPPIAELQNLKATLQYLDSQLQNWDPLVRRVRGQVGQITGEEIWAFVLSAFEKQRREGLTFEYTTAFWQSTFKDVKRPVFLGAMHNLVMNAGYWALKAGIPAKVKFSTAHTGLVVSDSGRGVHSRDMGRLFDPGFSRRPLGRGLGLYIARSCMRSFGYDVELLESPAFGALPGANFLISRTSD